jgi:hypothetical protein
MTHRCERISAAVGIEQADGDDRLAEESSHACDVVTPAPIDRCVHQNIGSNPIVTGTESRKHGELQDRLHRHRAVSLAYLDKAFDESSRHSHWLHVRRLAATRGIFSPDLIYMQASCSLKEGFRLPTARLIRHAEGAQQQQPTFQVPYNFDCVWE